MEFSELLAQATTPPDPADAPKRVTPLADVEDMIIQGQYAFPTGKMINVIGPNGDSYAAPSEQVKDALENGYRLEAPNEISKREFRQKYKGLKGDVIVGLGQFADEFFGGLPEVAFDALAKKDDFDQKETLKEDHEVANTLGGVLGFGASAFYGGPLAKLFGVGEKLGAETGKAVAKSLAARGLSKESAGLGAQIIAKTAENTAKMGVEGLVGAAPLAITETALGDPEAGAETLLMGGGLGLGLGIVSGPTSVIFSKANKAAKESVEKMFGKFENQAPDALNTGTGTLAGDLEALGADESIFKKAFEDGLKLKENAESIKEKTYKIGAKQVMEGQLVADKVWQDLDSTMTKSGTLVGIKRARGYQDIYDAARNQIKRIFNTSDEQLSKVSVGEQAKVKIIQSAKEAIDKEGAIFNALRMDYSQIPLDKKAMQSVIANVQKIANESLDQESVNVAKQFIRQYKEGRIDTLDKLFERRTQFRDMWSPTASNRYKKTLQDLIETLNTQEENTIDRAIKRRIEAARGVPGQAAFEEASRLQGLYDDMQAAKGRWRELAETLKESGEALGMSSVKNPADFVRKVSDMSAEELTKKLLPKNDIASLRILKKNFPEQFDSVVELEKAKMLEKMTKDKTINPVSFATEYRKMLRERPEFLKILFNDTDNEMLDAVREVMESIPENVNPSGTAKTLSYMEMLKGLGPTEILSTLGSNVGDYVAQKGLQKFVNVDDLANTQKAMGEVNKKLNKVPAIIRGLQVAGQVGEKMSSVSSIYAIGHLLGDTSKERREAFEQIKAKIEAASVSPQNIQDHMIKETEGYSASAPKITNEYITKTASAINYLNQNLPKPMQQQSPFFNRKWKPSDMDLAKFERKLAVTMDPFVVIDALQDGSLTKDHMEAMMVNYPVLTQALRSRVLDEITKAPANLPYQARLKVSLLMGYDIDGTTAPKTIANYQNSFAMMPEVSHNDEELNQSGLNKMKPAEPEWTQAQHGLLK